MNPTDLIQTTLAILTILSQILSLGIVIGLLTGYLQKRLKSSKITHIPFIISSYIVAMTAMLGSLFYSDTLGYDPCKLCWYQRIVMYPQTLLFLVALAKSDKKVGDYGMVLSFVGAMLALYHYLLQIGILTTTSCTTVGYSISCSDRFTTTYGYITIPMMALSAFVLIFLILLTQRLSKN